MNSIYELETVSATAKIANCERWFTLKSMSLAIVGVDKAGGSRMAGIPEARFMNAARSTRMEGKPRMAIAGLDASELLELALLRVAVGALSGVLSGLFCHGRGTALVRVVS